MEAVREQYGDEQAAIFEAELTSPEGRKMMEDTAAFKIALGSSGGDLTTLIETKAPMPVREGSVADTPLGDSEPGTLPTQTVVGDAPTFGDKANSILNTAGGKVNQFRQDNPNTAAALELGLSVALGGPVGAAADYFVGEAVEEAIEGNEAARNAVTWLLNEAAVLGTHAMSSGSLDEDREAAEGNNYEYERNVLTAGGVLIGIKSIQKLFKTTGTPTIHPDAPDTTNPNRGGANSPDTDGEAGYSNDGGFSDGSFAQGGHLISRHVGKTEQELIDRANGVGQRAPAGGASSFSNLEAAEFYANQVISANQVDIDNYLASGSTVTRAFSIQDTGQSTGRWVPKGGNKSQAVTGVTIIIRPNPNVPRGYDVITGHPCQTGLCPKK